MYVIILYIFASLNYGETVQSRVTRYIMLHNLHNYMIIHKCVMYAKIYNKNTTNTATIILLYRSLTCMGSLRFRHPILMMMTCQTVPFDPVN